MIKKISSNDTKLINLLEKKFEAIFLKNDIISDFNSNPYTNYLIYLENNNIVAFINYYLIYDRMEIVNFNVLENFQNRHIGSLLLKEVIRIAINLQLKNITLEVKKDNKKAIYLYHKFGFQDKAIRQNYYNDVDGILMEKELI